MRDSHPVAVLTTSAVVEDIRKYGAGRPQATAPRSDRGRHAGFRLARRSPTAASLRFRRRPICSTRPARPVQPAGVVVTHKNVVSNLEQLLHRLLRGLPDGVAPQDTTIVSWLPFYHDMGLDRRGVHPDGARAPGGADEPGGVHAEAGPVDAAAGDHTSSAFTAAPNFAFELAVRRTIG